MQAKEVEASIRSMSDNGAKSESLFDEYDDIIYESKNKIKKIDSTEIDKINNNIKKYLEELEKQEINISDVIEKVEARLIEINMVIYILKKGKSEYKEKTYNELTKNPITAIIFCIKPLFRR